MMVGFAIHTVYLLTRINWRTPVKSLFGEDSLVPNFADLKQFGQRVLWFFGLGSHPRFGRWTYWEKFDYWAVYWGLPLLAITGVMLMYPLVTSRFVPGWSLNIAALLHRAEAVLAVTYFYRSFFCRTPQAFQLSHERSDVFGQRSVRRSDRGKTGLGGKPAKLRQTE
jgi:cytochrome b subunit of formate dehydrogenase